MIEVKIVEKKENPFLERTDLKLLVKHSNQPTPTRKEIIKQISGKLKADASKVVIDYIFTETGKSESKVKAKVYKGKPPVKKVKKKAEKKPKPEKKPAEKPKEEKVAEAKPEEKPKEPEPEKKPEKEVKEEKAKEEKKVEEKKNEAQAK